MIPPHLWPIPPLACSICRDHAVRSIAITTAAKVDTVDQLVPAITQTTARNYNASTDTIITSTTVSPTPPTTAPSTPTTLIEKPFPPPTLAASISSMEGIEKPLPPAPPTRAASMHLDIVPIADVDGLWPTPLPNDPEFSLQDCGFVQVLCFPMRVSLCMCVALCGSACVLFVVEPLSF